MRKRWIFLAPLAIVGLLLFVALGGEIVLHLWNWLVPPIIGWRPITFWQAVGLLALCRILFGGFGRHGFKGSNFRRRMADRWDRMTPEEQARFREGMRGRRGCGPAPGEAHAE